MVMFALGQPDQKIREMDGQMPFEEWIYGKAPQAGEFVRINGNRVIRLEIAAVGKEPQIFDKDEVEGLMRTDGTPLAPAPPRARWPWVTPTATPTPSRADPTLRKEGEAVPRDSHQTHRGQ